jgi:tetratricopeptide (TPR) repeat protein
LNLFLRTIPLVVLVFLPATAQCAQRGSQGNLASTPTAYDKAFNLLQKGQANEALAEIDTALASEPSDPSLNNLRGLVAAQLGRTGEAEASFRKVIRLLPHAAMGYNNLAALLWQLGRYAEAAKSFRQALTEEPHNFTALVGLGTTLAATQSYGEAAPYLEKAWSIRPGDFQTGYELARALRELKRPAEAHKVLTRLSPPQDSAIAAKFYALSAGVAEQLGDRRAAGRDYRRAYELSPQSFEIYLALVRAALGTGDKQWVQLPPAPTGLSAEQHFALGLIFASGGDYRVAISHFQQTLQLQPTSYSTSYNLALAYKQAGESQAAIELLGGTLERQPTAELYNLLASLEEEAGRYVEAVRHYQQAADLDPDNEQYYFDLGAEYLVHLTFGPATEVFRVGSHKFPKSPRQYVGMGLAQFALRQYADAADAFIAALEINPSSPDAFVAWNALPTFVVVAEWQRIQPRLQRLAERFPGSAQALFCYAAALFRHSVASERADGFDLAQSLLVKAVHLNPKLAAAHLELATLYAHRKQSKEAVASFLEAIRLDPNSEMAHYRLAQTYRNLNQLALAERELDLYRMLSRNHRDQMAQSRSAIRQFVLAKPSSEPALMEQKAPF